MSSPGQIVGGLVGAAVGFFVPALGPILGAQLGLMVGGAIDPPTRQRQAATRDTGRDAGKSDDVVVVERRPCIRRCRYVEKAPATEFLAYQR